MYVNMIPFGIALIYIIPKLQIPYSFTFLFWYHTGLTLCPQNYLYIAFPLQFPTLSCDYKEIHNIVEISATSSESQCCDYKDIYFQSKSSSQSNHDVVNKWKHFPRYWPFVRGIHRSPVNSPNKGQWHGALMFSLICAWINDWVNNRKAGDLRRHRAHYDVSVMIIRLLDIRGIDSAFCGDLTVPSQRPHATPMNFWFLECAHMHVCWMIAGEASDIFWSSHTGYKNNIPNVIWMAYVYICFFSFRARSCIVVSEPGHNWRDCCELISK